jgi:hypothetical protein
VPEAAQIAGSDVPVGPGCIPGETRDALGGAAMELPRRTWSTVREAVMLGLGLATQVIELIRAIRGGLM